MTCRNMQNCGKKQVLWDKGLLGMLTTFIEYRL